MTKRLTTEEFIKRANIVHNDRYLYNKSVYNNGKTKVCIICTEHGEFWQSPSVHIRDKCGCPTCGNHFTHSLDSITKRFIEKHGNKYDYTGVKYKNALTKVSITCNEHGPFLQTPADHYTGHGCPTCKSCKATYSWVDIHKVFLEKHNNYYIYDHTTYKNGMIKMKIICPEHGEFWQKPELHKNGAGCKLCNASGGPGMYCETIFKRTPSLADTHGHLYFLKLIDEDNTVFYKIGITTNLTDRLKYFTRNNGKLMWSERDTIYNCFLKEQKILSDNKQFSYKPKKLMGGGITECLKIEIKA